MIGELAEALVENRCNRCRHWHEHVPHRDPSDENWGFGECRSSAPVLVSSLVELQIERPQYGRQADLKVRVLDLCNATRFPVTNATDWCGRYMSREA